MVARVATVTQRESNGEEIPGADGGTGVKRGRELEARANRLCDRLFFWQLYSSVKRTPEPFSLRIYFCRECVVKRPTFSGAQDTETSASRGGAKVTLHSGSRIKTSGNANQGAAKENASGEEIQRDIEIFERV